MKLLFGKLLRNTSAAALLLLATLAGGCSMQDFGGGSDELTEAMEHASTGQGGEATEVRSQKLAHLLLNWRQQNVGAEEDYRIGPGDVLEINVFALEHPGQASVLSRSVSAEGSVNLPFIGDLLLKGLTARQAIQAVTDAYDGAYLRNPQVAVTITEFRSAPIVITGAVKLPGVYYLRRQSSTVLEMLSLANGLAPEAGNELLIVRGETATNTEDTVTTDAEPETVAAEIAAPPDTAAVSNATESVAETTVPAMAPSIDTGENTADHQEKPKKRKAKNKKTDEPSAPPAAPEAVAAENRDEEDEDRLPAIDDQMVSVDLRRLLDSGDIRHNVIVHGGDVITVPPRKKEFVYVLGYVQRPGAVEIREDQQMQALQAVAVAGGLATSARAQNSTLITERNGRRKSIPVDLTSIKRGDAPPAYLKPGDILIVGSSSMAKVAEFIKLNAGANYSPAP